MLWVVGIIAIISSLVLTSVLLATNHPGLAGKIAGYLFFILLIYVAFSLKSSKK